MNPARISENLTLSAIDMIMFGGAVPDPREPHTGVFTGCVGEFSAEYLGNDVDIRTIENAVLNYYEFEDIGFDTWQEFQAKFRNMWNGRILQLIENIENAEDFTVTDSSESVNETRKYGNVAEASSTAHGEFSDTPNQRVPNTFTGLTNMSDFKSGGKSETAGSEQRDLTIDRGGNKFERWLELSAKNRNIIYDFLEAFEPLFCTTYTISL